MSESERFARQVLIPGWNQSSLSRARVVVVGLGALGNEVTRILAMAGVRSFLLCDPDHVERSNLSRTVLFRETHLGRLKVEAAAESLIELSSGVEVATRPLPLVHGVGLAELRDASLVLGCLDSRSARLELAGRCNLVGAKLVDGGTQPWGGEIRLALALNSPCYGCTLSAEERAVADEPWSCLDDTTGPPVGAAVTTSALVGSWMAQFAIRHLMGLDIPAGLLRVDAERGQTGHVPLHRDPECPLHETIEEAQLIPVTANDRVANLRAILRNGGSVVTWAPFQERVECPSCSFEQSSFGLPAKKPCPRCGSLLRPRTTLELDSAPDGTQLAALGIAPREILAARAPGGEYQFLELGPNI
jgi:molybdopterin/thiamine biosynthesis adenylyltransferase